LTDFHNTLLCYAAALFTDASSSVDMKLMFVLPVNGSRTYMFYHSRYLW